MPISSPAIPGRNNGLFCLSLLAALSYSKLAANPCLFSSVRATTQNHPTVRPRAGAHDWPTRWSFPGRQRPALQRGPGIDLDFPVAVAQIRAVSLRPPSS
jgi:hypothetical protein